MERPNAAREIDTYLICHVRNIFQWQLQDLSSQYLHLVFDVHNYP